MGVRFQRGRCPARSGRTSGALLVIHLCVWLLHRDGVLFRVQSSAEVMIWLGGLWGVTARETDWVGTWPPEGS